jgi:hypothetical protein
MLNRPVGILSPLFKERSSILSPPTKPARDDAKSLPAIMRDTHHPQSAGHWMRDLNDVIALSS